MNDFDVKLFARFPTFFHPENTSGSLMRFGCDIGMGWQDLVWRLCEDIEALNPSSDFEVLQVKSKFAELRFYTKGSNEQISDLIREAERRSCGICEECGKPGTTRVRASGWFITACDEHAIDRDGTYLEAMEDE